MFFSKVGIDVEQMFGKFAQLNDPKFDYKQTNEFKTYSLCCFENFDEKSILIGSQDRIIRRLNINKIQMMNICKADELSHLCLLENN